MAALSEAADATAVVVDGEMPGYQELCAHLKADPITASIPLIFLVHTGKEDPGVKVDAKVAFHDPAALERALRQFCPSLALSSGPTPEMDVLAPEPMDDDMPEAEDLFNVKEDTALFRRPTTEPGTALEWPPPPPEQGPGQDMVAYAKSYAGYFNSLIEAREQPDILSEAECIRLDQMAELAVDDAETLISKVQTAMNDALREKDLDKMRVLSTTKNRLYEKRQRLRTIMSEEGAAKPASPARAGRPQSAGEILEDGWDMDSGEDQPAVPRSLSDSGGYQVTIPDESAVPQQKSALTMAAEAKDLERRKTARQKRLTKKVQVQKSPAYAAAAARRKNQGYQWVWIPVAGLMVLVATLTIIYSIGKREPDQKVKVNNNSAPVMKWVLLEQAPAGVVARPQAEDKEKDRVTFSITWYINGKEAMGQHTARLKPKHYQSGDVIFVEVTSADMHAQGRAMRSRELTIKEDFGRRRPAP